MECFGPAPWEDLAIAEDVHCSLTDSCHRGYVEHLSIKVLIVKHAKAKCKCLTSIWKTKWRWQHNKAHHDIYNVNGDDKYDDHHDTNMMITTTQIWWSPWQIWWSPWHKYDGHHDTNMMITMTQIWWSPWHKYDDHYDTNMMITMTLLQALPLLIEDSAGMIESSSSLSSTLNIIYFLLVILNLCNYIKHSEKMTNLESF